MAQQPWGPLLNFGWLVKLVECPHVLTTNLHMGFILCIIIGYVHPLDHGFVWVVLIFLFARIFILMKIFKVVLCFVLNTF